jgi:D-xylose transport system permease protein
VSDRDTPVVPAQPAASTAAPAEAQVVAEGGGGLSGAFHAYVVRLKAGDVGSLPVIVSLTLATVYFTAQSPVFFTALNFANLITQVAVTALIAIGVVFVLLIGEIDLSIGSVTGVCAVCVAYFAEPDTSHTVPGLVAILLALLLGLLIGLIQGSIVAIVGVPSFVVTLSGLLIFLGVIIRWIGGQASIGIDDPLVNDFANYWLPEAWGWAVAAIVSIGFAATVGYGIWSRKRAGLPIGNVSALVFRVVLVGVLTWLVVAICNHGRAPGVPFSGVTIVTMVVFWTFISRRTTFGRHVYAVGGNPEAARRSGINVPFTRIVVFMISGLMAALGGVVLAGQLGGVSSGVGSYQSTFLDAIAAAVIGGTSLTGGRGRVVGALLGATVIGTIYNGLGLLGTSAATQYLIDGAILLIAVTLDTIARRKLAQSGR